MWLRLCFFCHTFCYCFANRGNNLRYDDCNILHAAAHGLQLILRMPLQYSPSECVPGGTLTMECFVKGDHIPPGGISIYRGQTILGNDPRMTIEFDKNTGRICLTVKKCKTLDEAKYKVQLLDEKKKTLDFAGFSVFVKGLYISSSTRLLKLVEAVWKFSVIIKRSCCYRSQGLWPWFP